MEREGWLYNYSGKKETSVMNCGKTSGFNSHAGCLEWNYYNLKQPRLSEESSLRQFQSKLSNKCSSKSKLEIKTFAVVFYLASLMSFITPFLHTKFTNIYITPLIGLLHSDWSIANIRSNIFV